MRLVAPLLHHGRSRNRAVRIMFRKMYDAGLIYRGDYLVNWDPVAQTALSDDEVEHEEKASFLWHIRYPLADGKGSITVATTRPETMLGDTAVAVHPEDERYRHLIGKQIALPLSQRTIPDHRRPFVDPKFGTGARQNHPCPRSQRPRGRQTPWTSPHQHDDSRRTHQ